MSRVRLSLLAPFEPAKILFPMPADISRISHLKRHLVRSLSSIASVTTSAKELRLEIDGFELLSGAAIDVIREDDVVCVTVTAGSSFRTASPAGFAAKGKKRKALVDRQVSQSASALGGYRAVSASPAPPAKKHRKVSNPSINLASNARPAQTQRSMSSDSSSSVSSTSSSSEPSSSSDSDSAESASDESTAPTSLPSRDVSTAAKLADPFPVFPHPLLSRSPHVPPGQGKPSTQNRNQRRRLARRMKQIQDEGQQPGASGTISEATTGSSAAASNTVTSLVDPTFPAPKTLSNRNKRKGFKEDMTGVKATRTIFDTDAHAEDRPEPERVQTPTDVEERTVPVDDALLPFVDGPITTPQIKRKGARAVPPSAQELPVNAFVTAQSYDQHRGQRHWVPAIDYKEDDQQSSNNHETQQSSNNPETAGTHAEAAEASVMGAAAQMPRVRSWWGEAERAKVEFEYLEPLTARNLGTLRKGDSITWRQLELDPWTYSPELVVHIGEVTAYTEDPTFVIVRPIKLSSCLEVDEDGYEPYEDEEVTEEDYGLNDAKVDENPEHWRLLRRARAQH